MQSLATAAATISLVVPDSGNTYRGRVDAAATSGKFTCTSNGNIYIGGFSGKAMHGYGKMICHNGDAFIGVWQFGIRVGLGEESINGDVLRTLWVDGKRCGPGVYKHTEGYIHRGLYDSDKRNGPGEYTWGDGQVYIGDFLHGKRNGFGSLLLPNGDKFIGEWRDCKRHGTGRYVRSSGEIRDRVWKADAETSERCDMSALLPIIEQGILHNTYIFFIWNLISHYYSACTGQG